MICTGLIWQCAAVVVSFWNVYDVSMLLLLKDWKKLTSRQMMMAKHYVSLANNMSLAHTSAPLLPIFSKLLSVKYFIFLMSLLASCYLHFILLNIWLSMKNYNWIMTMFHVCLSQNFVLPHYVMTWGKVSITANLKKKICWKLHFLYTRVILSSKGNQQNQFVIICFSLLF